MTHINVVTGVNEFRGLLMPHTLASLHRNQRITMCVIMTQLQNTKKTLQSAKIVLLIIIIVNTQPLI